MSSDHPHLAAHSDLSGLTLDSERTVIAEFRDYVSDAPYLDSDMMQLLAAEWGLAYAVRAREMWEDALDEILERLEQAKASLGDDPMLGAAIWLANERLHWQRLRKNLAAQAGEIARLREQGGADPAGAQNLHPSGRRPEHLRRLS